jgi:hypothetical protein
LPDIADPQKVQIADLEELRAVAPAGSPLPEYALPIEQRQPLEVRVTEIDLNALRSATLGTSSGGTGVADDQDYMLPNSGIIYASRDDALPDITDPSDPSSSSASSSDSTPSATDFKLDPTRRPNGIRLINGGTLSRGSANTDRIAEKGLILATNEPVYIMADENGDFDAHYKFGSTTLVEEFETQLNRDDYNNFYTRGDGAPAPRRGRNLSFACRDQQAGCEEQGDQWRAARILADSVTLLSNKFRDGFRNEADFDLNNNAGNLLVDARLKNGFWWNSFAPSATWYDTSSGYPDTKAFEAYAGDPPAKTQGSSYVMNGVTPIQRRTSFPAYKMEMCRKVPVSECEAQDWHAFYDNTDPDSKALDQAAGRTDFNFSTLPVAQRSAASLPRRVAFSRNAFGQLNLDDNGYAIPKVPGGPGGTPLSYGSATVTAAATGTAVNPFSSSPPAAATNALWFATSLDNDRPNRYDPLTPGSGFDFGYAANNPLYYLPDEPETPLPGQEVRERQLLLPGTPTFPDSLPGDVEDILNALNGLTDLDPSDYAVCSASKVSKTYDGTVNPGVNPCPALARILPVWNRLRGLAAVANVVSVAPLNVDGATPNVATAPVSVFDIPPTTNGVLNIPLSFERGTQTNPIIVIRMTQGVSQPISFVGAFNMQLRGIDPNNIFWVPNRPGLRFTDGTYKVTGNFIGLPQAGSLIRVQGTTANRVVGGRFLGFYGQVVGGVANNPFPPNFMTAMTTTDQPLLVPILQLHSPTGTPSNNRATAFGGTESITNRWLQHASDSTFNAAFVMGDSPSRPFPEGQAAGGAPSDLGESGGGLHNLPRFLEAWEESETGTGDPNNPRKTIINGSFIQLKRSTFATAPFETVNDRTKDNSLFFDDSSPGVPPYMEEYQSARRAYLYKGGGQGRKAPFYKPPSRLWGYDIGFLSQRPDLFSRRFSTPSAGNPSKYFREVGRDDNWVKTLLCAVEKSDPTLTDPTAYDRPAVNTDQRPAACPPINQYQS